MQTITIDYVIEETKNDNTWWPVRPCNMCAEMVGYHSKMNNKNELEVFFDPQCKCVIGMPTEKQENLDDFLRDINRKKEMEKA